VIDIARKHTPRSHQPSN